MTSLAQKVVAEGLGTFALVFIGCGAILVDAEHGAGLGTTGIALAFGLVVMVMIYALGHVSGAHFNPAVTLAFAARATLPWREVVPYVLGQCAGAVLGALLLRGILDPTGGLGATQPSGGVWPSLALEGVLTFFLMFVITSVATDARAVGSMAGLAIGGTVAIGAMVGGPISGASMNPARSLGPALVAGDVGALWLYVLGPCVGALCGAFLYRAICCQAPARDADDGC